MSYKLLLYRDEAYPDSHIADRFPAALKEMLPNVEVVLARTRAEEGKVAVRNARRMIAATVWGCTAAAHLLIDVKS